MGGQRHGQAVPEVGSLSIDIGSDGDPVCVVETTEVHIRGFAEVDAAFAYNYGEWDRSRLTLVFASSHVAPARGVSASAGELVLDDRNSTHPARGSLRATTTVNYCYYGYA